MIYRLILPALILWAGAAIAVLPPSAYDRLKADAPIHLAMTIERVEAPAAGRSGICRVTGPISKLYRDRTGRLKRGQRITVSLDCFQRGARLPAGGVIWMPAERLKAGRTLTTYLTARLGVAAQGHGTKVSGD